jgi:solute:Na+ symporter, SSS family
VRPGASFWGPIVEKAPDVSRRSQSACNLLDWFCGCVLVYLTLFGVGKLIFGDWTTGIVYLVLALLAGAVIYWDLNRRGWETVIE